MNRSFSGLQNAAGMTAQVPLVTSAKQPREIQVSISGLGDDGLGTGRFEERTVRVKNGLPGESVSTKVLRKRRGILYTEAFSVVTPSSDRRVSACSVFPRCGGCALHHMDYQAQLKLKEQTLMRALADFQVEPLRVAAPVFGPRLHYRNKARLGVRIIGGSPLVGFRESFSSRVVRMDDCKTLILAFANILAPLKEVIGRLSIRHKIPQIELAAGDHEQAIIVRHLEPMSNEDLSLLKDFAQWLRIRIYLQPKGYDSVWLLAPTDAPEYLHYLNLDFGLCYHFLPTDFVQVNPFINRVLVRTALNLLNPKPGKQVIDLFCGIGNFSLAAARLGGWVTGYESSATAVRRALHNAALNGLSVTTRFKEADLYDSSSVDFADAQYLILDPPRTGAGENLSRWLSSDGFKYLQKAVYVSCNPVTFASDAATFERFGLQLSEVGIFDMFPHTAHVETLGLFERRG